MRLFKKLFVPRQNRKRKADGAPRVAPPRAMMDFLESRRLLSSVTLTPVDTQITEGAENAEFDITVTTTESVFVEWETEDIDMGPGDIREYPA